VASFYAEIADVALDLLTEFGQTVVFTRVTGATYSTATGGYTGGTTTTVTGKGAGFDFDKKEIDGIHVIKGDMRMIFYATTAPLAGDTCVVGGVSYRCVSVEAISPGGTAVLYDAQLRV
jgi:hypothetical protein